MGQFDAVLSNPATRRTFLRSMAVAGGMGVLAACRKDTTSGPGAGGTSSVPVARPPITEETGDLSVHEWLGYDAAWIWKDYATDGYPEPNFSFLTNTEGVIAKTQGGFKWDLTHPEVGYIQDYVNMGVLEPWDTSLIPNHADLNPVLTQAGMLDGKQYEVVLDWGYSGVIIRSDMVDPSINSYSYLFDDNLEGKIGWFDTPWILQMAAMVIGIPAEEGFFMTDAQLEDAKNYAIEKSKNVYTIWVDFNAMWDDIRKGNMWAAYSWPDTYVVLKPEGIDVTYIRPKEGVLSWAEGLVLRKGTENYYHAHEFADAWASPATGERLIGSWGYGHSNLNVDLSKIDPDVVSVFGLDDPEGSLSEPNSYIDRYQPERAKYNAAWTEVKAAMGAS